MSFPFYAQFTGTQTYTDPVEGLTIYQAYAAVNTSTFKGVTGDHSIAKSGAAVVSSLFDTESCL